MAQRPATEGARAAETPPVPFPGSYWVIEGTLLAGEYPGHEREETARRKLERLLDAGIRTIVDLTETSDPLEPYEDLLADIADGRDIDVRYRRLPIRDMDVPTSTRMTEILSLVEDELAAGRPVYVHCWGGIGRTGTVAACWMVEQGLSCDDALARLRELRAKTPDAWKESPQTDAQRTFVREWTRRRSDR